MTTPSLLIFGAGYLGMVAAREAMQRGMTVRATSRDADRRAALEAGGLQAVDPLDETAMQAAVADGSVVVSVWSFDAEFPPSGAGLGAPHSPRRSALKRLRRMGQPPPAAGEAGGS